MLPPSVFITRQSYRLKCSYATIYLKTGYGKYDRALGIQYMLGVWDLLDRLDEEKKKG